MVKDHAMNKKTILVIDDEKDIVSAVKRILEKAGYTVMPAYDGNEGYAYALKQTPDLIITDIIMPGKTGIELLKTLKESKITKQIPVILLTQRDSFDDIFQGYRMGADNFLPKPFNAEILLQAVQTLLEKPD
jgi:DNA-binding response OmpR family regulator